jgi:hypothetical protein
LDGDILLRFVPQAFGLTVILLGVDSIIHLFIGTAASVVDLARKATKPRRQSDIANEFPSFLLFLAPQGVNSYVPMDQPYRSATTNNAGQSAEHVAFEKDSMPLGNDFRVPPMIEQRKSEYDSNSKQHCDESVVARDSSCCAVHEGEGAEQSLEQLLPGIDFQGFTTFVVR